MPIYRRGAVYWWRRNLSCPSGGTAPITIRISLRTASAGQAKTRAASLELEWNTVSTNMEETLRYSPTRDDLARVYHIAFKTELDRIVVKQAATPMRAPAHAAFNRVYAQIFTLLTRAPRPLVPDAALMDELIDAGLDPGEAEKLHLTLQMHSRHGSLQADLTDGFVDPGPDGNSDDEGIGNTAGGRLTVRARLSRQASPISPAQVGAYLQEAGVRATGHNKDAALRIVAAAYRNACLEACKLLDMPVAAGTVWPLPGNLLALIGIEDPEGGQTTPTVVPPLDPLGSASDGRFSSTAESRHVALQEPKDLPISELAAAAITARVEAKEWDAERARDVNAAVKLFVAANGDIPFSTMRQHHLASTVAMFPSLPVRYGFARKDPRTGEQSQETIAEALVRGRTLRKRWDADPVLAEQEKLPQVGLGHVTHNKHLTWLNALGTYAQSAGRPYPTGLNFSILRLKASTARRAGGGATKKNEALAAFAVADLRHLIEAPIWTGCADLRRRFEPGNLVIHDAWYWCPLIIILHGCRSDEGTGFALDDVDTASAIPTIRFRSNMFRRVKTAASDRTIPIHPKLIDLGFLDYVRAMRALGHRAAFPELLHPTLGFDHNFYDKIFEPLRACQFPSGTSRMRGRKDVDVRSIRSRCVSHLRDVGCPKPLAQAIVGHEVGDVTSDIYEEDPDPALLLPWVEKLGDLLPPIPFHSLNLRPREWQKFGSPRGRPAKF